MFTRGFLKQRYAKAVEVNSYLTHNMMSAFVRWAGTILHRVRVACQIPLVRPLAATSLSCPESGVREVHHKGFVVASNYARYLPKGIADPLLRQQTIGECQDGLLYVYITRGT